MNEIVNLISRKRADNECNGNKRKTNKRQLFTKVTIKKTND